MAYVIEAFEQPGIAIRRIAGEEIRSALEEIRRNDAPVEWRIHQLRRRCKKIRAAARLVRADFKPFSEVNRRFRDISYRFSTHRDARVIAELVSELCDSVGPAADSSHPAVRWYWSRYEFAAEHATEALNEVEPVLAGAAVDIEHWQIDGITVESAVHGFCRTLNGAHAGFRDVGSETTARIYHDWRKFCVYHSLHALLCAEVLPSIDERRYEDFSRLGSLLGTEHDCSILIDSLSSLPSFMSQRAEVMALLTAVTQRQRALRVRCLKTAETLFAESAHDVCERISAHWTARLAERSVTVDVDS